MRIVVSDTSCLIDLRKADLLAALLALPYRIQVPFPLVSDDLSSFGQADWDRLTDLGLEIVDLEPRLVARSLEYKKKWPRLSAYDAFSLALAGDGEGMILLTADLPLRRAAEAAKVEVHGVLWVIDEIDGCGILPAGDLFVALQRLRADPLVFLPRDEVEARLHRLRRRSGP